MFLDLLKKINNYEIRENNRELFNEPVSENKLQILIKESRLALQYTPCDEYLDLLRLTDEYDNCNDDGVNFYSCSDFVGCNLDWREIEKNNKYIIFGSYASAPIYLYDTEKRKYLVADRFYFPDDEAIHYNTFDELISDVLKERINEINESV